MNMAGRPPKDPSKKKTKSVRATVTPPVLEAIKEDMMKLGFNVPRRGDVTVDYLRLLLFRRLDQVNLLDEYELREDTTWDTLIEEGKV